jgi:alpha-glucosidase
MRRAVMDIMQYWLEMGVDGFRLDVVNFFIKDHLWRSNPLTIGHTPRPYDLQKHLFDRNRPETLDIVKELRRLTDRFAGRVLIGEVYTPTPGDARLSAAYLGNGHDALHLAFDFSLLYCKYGVRPFRDAVECWYTALKDKGWPCNVLSNHDQPRSFSRYKYGRDSIPRAKVLAAMLLTLKGTPFIYYGEEIGMADGKIRKQDLQDPVGKKYWPLHKGRDRARTPMQWSDRINAGFSNVRPWLPVNADFSHVNVARQANDPDSLLNFYKDLIALRRREPALQYGDWTYIHNDAAAMAYHREISDSRLAVWLNFGRRARLVTVLNPHRWKVLFGTHKASGAVLQGFDFELAPHEVVIFKQVPS